MKGNRMLTNESLNIMCAIAMLSLGNNSMAMHFRGRPVIVDIEQEQQVDQRVKPTAGFVGQQCLCDGLKVTVGATATAASLIAMFGHLVGCAAPREYMDATGKLFCSDTGGMTILTCGGVSLLYTGYHTLKLLWHSSVLTKITAEQSFKCLAEAVRQRNASYQDWW